MYGRSKFFHLLDRALSQPGTRARIQGKDLPEEGIQLLPGGYVGSVSLLAGKTGAEYRIGTPARGATLDAGKNGQLILRGGDVAEVNWMAALERWRESGIAPDRLIISRVSNNRVNMTRPICSYPAVAHYNGVGSTNDAANFVCKVP